MKANEVRAWCTAVKEPRPYEIEGRKGISYKIEVSDGTASMEMPIDESVYLYMQPMREYLFDLDFTQVSRETKFGIRKDFKVRVIAAQEV